MPDPPGRPRILRAAGTVGGYTGLSRILGLLRDTLMGSFFGTSLTMSAFALAFRIPNLFRRLFGEGALSAAFVPVFVQVRTEQGPRAAWELAAHVFNLLAAFLVILVALLQIALTVAMRYEWGEETALLLPLTRLMLPYTVFICLVGMCMGMLNAHGRFALPAATPCVLNLAWIAALFLLVPRADPPIYGVAWGVLIAGVVQLAIQFPALARLGFRPRWGLGRGDPMVGRILVLLLPAALGAAVTQVNVLVDSFLAYFWIGDYATAALYFSERLIYLPLGLFATALGTVLLPTFSVQAAERDPAGMERTLMQALRNLLFVMIPAAIGLVVLAGPIVRMIFEWGAFQSASVDQVALALKFYAPGLVVFSLAKIFVPAFYAQQDTRTPVKIAACCVVLNICLNLLFIATWPEGTKHGGIALGTVLAEAVFAGVLWFILQRRLGLRGWGIVLRSWGRSLIAGALMGISAWGLVHGLGPLLGDGKAAQVAVTLGGVGVGMAVYFAAATALRSPEIADVLSALKRMRK